GSIRGAPECGWFAADVLRGALQSPTGAAADARRQDFHGTLDRGARTLPGLPAVLVRAQPSGRTQDPGSGHQVGSAQCGDAVPAPRDSRPAQAGFQSSAAGVAGRRTCAVGGRPARAVGIAQVGSLQLVAYRSHVEGAYQPAGGFQLRSVVFAQSVRLVRSLDRGAGRVSRCVMLVVDGLGLSGKTKALVDLAVGLDRRRFEPCVVCFRTEDSPLANVLRQAGGPLLEVPVGERLRFANLWRMFRVIRRLRPEILHCYNPRAMLYGGLAARALGIRAVLGSLSAFACMVPDRSYAFLPQPLVTSS